MGLILTFRHDQAATQAGVNLHKIVQGCSEEKL